MPEPNWFEDYLNSLRRKGEFAKEFPFLQPPPEAVSDVRTAPFKLPKPMTIAEAGLEETPFRPEAERKIRQTLGIAELPPTEPRKTVEELLGREPYQPRVVGGYELPRWQQELSDMAAVALGIQGVGIPAAQQSWRALTNLALTRQVSRLESGQGRPITKEQAQYFANQLRGEAQKRGFQWDLDKQSLRDLFKSTRGRTVPTLEATQRAEETAQQAVNRFAPAIIPKGTQTGALAFGGRTPTPESVAAKIAQGQALSKAEEQLKGNNPQAVQTALNQLKGIQTPLPPVLSEVAREAPTGRFAVTLRNIGDILSPEENFTQKGNLKPQARTQLIKDVVEAVDNGVLGIEEAGTLLNEYINHPLLNKGDYEGFLAYWKGRPQALITTKPSAPMTEGELATFLQAPKPVTPTAPAAPAVTKLSPTITITHITSAKGGEFVLKPIKITNDESGLFLEPDKITFAGIAVKPSGGLWTAPGNTWEEYLKSRGKELSERWKDTTAKVTFEVETKNVVVIDSIDDAKNKLPWKKGIRHPVVDFTALKKGGATGVYLTRKGEAQTRRHPKYPLMGWDIESLLILDEKIVTVKSIEKAGEPPGTIVKVTKPIIKVASSPTFTAKRKAALQDIVDATKIERISPGHPKYQEVVDDGGASYDIPTHTVFITTTPRPPPKIVFHEVAHDLWEQDRAPKAVIKTFISEFNKWQETPQGLKATAPHKRMTKEYGVVAFTKDNAELFAEVFKRVAMGIPHNQFPKTNAAIYKWLDTPGAAKSVTTAAIPEVEAGPTQALTTTPAQVLTEGKMFEKGAAIGAPPMPPPPKPPVTTGGEETLPDPEQDAERLTPEQVEETFALMKSLLGDPKTKEFTNSIKILQKKELSRRARNLEPRINELLAEGVPAEEAMRQATKEVMSGELVKSPAAIGQRFTQLMRDALFARIKEKLAGEPFEILSTNDALTNFLVTGKVPDVPGIAGGSARTRLERVFGDQPEIMKFIDREKPLADIVKEIFYKIEPPTPLDQKSVEYLRSLSDIPRIDENGQIVALDKQLTSFGLPSMLNSPYEQLVTNDPRSAAEQLYGLEKLLLGTALAEGKISKTTYDIELSIARDKMAPLPDTTQYEPPIQKAIRQPSLIPELEQHRLVSVLKELAWLPNDIAQLVRATKASVDNSWGRQAHITAVRHPRSFMRNQILGIQAMFSQEVADAAWLRLTRSPNYAIYEKYGPPRGFDMYRMPAELVGKDITLGAEEFGYLNKERLLPRITANLPWIKFSARGFNTAINGYTSDLFDMGVAQFQKNQLRVASGEIKLKPLQSYDVGSKISDLIAFLSEAHGRGSLRYNILGSQVDLKGVAPVLNSAFFALRNNLAQFMLPRHLFNFRNPEIARMAWENIFTYIALVGGIVTLGKLTGVWDTDDDPTSADYGNILLFDGKVHIDPWMGRKQWVVFISRLARGTGISAESGVKYQVDPISTTTSFMRFRSAPGTSFILDVATGKTAVGEKLNLKNPKQWAERVSPFSMWDIYEAWYTVGALGGVMATPLAIQGVGVQAYGFGWKKDFASYNLIPTDPNERESKGTMSRTEYRVKRPDIDAKLFIIGEVTSLQTEAAANYVIKFALANKVDLRTIPEVDRRIAEINKRVDLGLPAKLENTPTDALVRYILSGQLQSNPQPKAPTPQPSVPQSFSSEEVLERLFGK